MTKYKICPMLTSYVTHEPIMIGQGAVTVPELKTCIGDVCGAYKDGFCNKYMTQVASDDKEDAE